MFFKSLLCTRHKICHSHPVSSFCLQQPSFIVPIPQVTRWQHGEVVYLAKSQQVGALRFGPGPLFSSWIFAA